MKKILLYSLGGIVFIGLYLLIIEVNVLQLSVPVLMLLRLIVFTVIVMSALYHLNPEKMIIFPLLVLAFNVMLIIIAIIATIDPIIFTIWIMILFTWLIFTFILYYVFQRLRMHKQLDKYRKPSQE